MVKRKAKDKPYFNLIWHVADDVLDCVSCYFSFELKKNNPKSAGIIIIVLIIHLLLDRLLDVVDTAEFSSAFN